MVLCVLLLSKPHVLDGRAVPSDRTQGRTQARTQKFFFQKFILTYFSI